MKIEEVIEEARDYMREMKIEEARSAAYEMRMEETRNALTKRITGIIEEAVLSRNAMIERMMNALGRMCDARNECDGCPLELAETIVKDNRVQCEQDALYSEALPFLDWAPKEDNAGERT
jgi:vacuolar-type H+-ATPase subunit D/Vma8